jgi:hypothetical protein
LSFHSLERKEKREKKIYSNKRIKMALYGKHVKGKLLLKNAFSLAMGWENQRRLIAIN